MLELAEVLLAEAVQRRAIHLGGAAHEVVHVRLERRAVAVVPGVRGDIAPVHEHVAGLPVLRLAGEPVAALEQQDALARRGEMANQRAATGAAPDHDHVVGTHLSSSTNSPSMIPAAAWISARWENACGKLPR